METPTSLIEAVRYFSDLAVCNDYMKRIKWPDGTPQCPHCESERLGEITTRALLRCKDCRKQFSYKVGTIFEDSPLGLDKWFVAVWAIANCKNGISSYELARALGVTQKTGWFMLHRIREAMKSRTFTKLSGTVESDETFVGGKAENMHKARREKVIRGRGSVGKIIVQGVLERKGDVRCEVIASTDGPTVQGTIVRHVQPGAKVYTDGHEGYSGLWTRFVHDTVDHATEYVRGVVHTNGIENFWSLLKRSIRGTYIIMSVMHLARYLDEQAFRFNRRHGDDFERFLAALQGTIGRRLTYRRLCQIDDCGFMGKA